MRADTEVAVPVLHFASNLTRIGVPHAFTTRRGGVSEGVFASLNFGNPGVLPPSERDPAKKILENFSRVLGAIGAPGRAVAQTHQMHGAGVVVLRAGDDARPDGHDPKGDAMVTDDPARVVAVRIADCAPILLSSVDGRVVAAVHAGWRGVVAGVAAAAVKSMQVIVDKPIMAAIGPCIGAAKFEVGEEVAAEFRRLFGDESNVVRRASDAKSLVDLRAALRLQLECAGAAEVEQVGGCTVTEASLYFSHRRENGVTGRMIGVIGALPAARN